MPHVSFESEIESPNVRYFRYVWGIQGLGLGLRLEKVQTYFRYVWAMADQTYKMVAASNVQAHPPCQHPVHPSRPA